LRARVRRFLSAVTLLAWPVFAGVLPEERADVLYHRYDGGGVTISGPSVLVRKQAGKDFSISANYYVDSVSSASIDVVTSASPYREERTQESIGVDYLRGKTLMSLGYVTSDENDYSADTAHFSLSQDIFGDLTTVTLGYSRGWDQVRRTGDPGFAQDTDRRSYNLGLSQIVTRNLLLGLEFESITDEGFLNNPYRSVRYVDPQSANGYSFEPELYPHTHTSGAFASRARYYMPWRAALSGQYRYYGDTWDVTAHTVELGYTHPLKRGIILDFKYRWYTQTHADFYSDLFERPGQFNFRARDKELSTFTSQALRVGASYDIARQGWRFIDKGTVNLYLDHMMFDYEDFRDLTRPATPGDEPLYGFDANVIQLFVSFWY
jgi:hypothetical protein